MAHHDDQVPDRLVDVYLDGRLIATCPVTGDTPEPVPPPPACQALIAQARQMLCDDGVMSSEALSRAHFTLRRPARQALL